MTFAAALAATRGGELALRGPDGDFSWAQVDAWLHPAVVAMQNLDLGPRRRLAIVAENSGATLLTYVAATLAGASAVAVIFHLEPAELAYLLQDSAAAAVFTDDATATRANRSSGLAAALCTLPLTIRKCACAPN